MTKKLLFLFLAFIVCQTVSAQTLEQYFDGADTILSKTLQIDIDTSSGNVWQIGPPQKVIFDSAATVPNVIVTDTINTYPADNISRFSFRIKPFHSWGILALRWKQKLDLDTNRDGGIIEYSTDGGTNWKNVFNNPEVYNFYGYDSVANKDTLLTGEYAFSGTDSLWKDIWLCFDQSFLTLYDSALVRFTLKSDTIDNNREGWMIDNMRAQITVMHTVKQMDKGEYLRIYPTRTSGVVHIEAEKLQEFHIIESMQLVNTEGRIVKRYGKSPVKYFIDISDLPDGLYYLKINTNKRAKTFPVELRR